MMKRQGNAVAVILALVLCGCATRQLEPEIKASAIPAGTAKCSTSVDNAASCVVELTVAPKGMDGCEIEFVDADSDLIPVKRGVSAINVYWRIISPGYIFTRDGVAFIDNFRPRAFTDGQRLDDAPNEFAWTNLNPRRRIHAYVISVRTPQGAAPQRSCEKDPWIRNR
jgi:hypothetical protein